MSVPAALNFEEEYLEVTCKKEYRDSAWMISIVNPSERNVWSLSGPGSVNGNTAMLYLEIIDYLIGAGNIVNIQYSEVQIKCMIYHIRKEFATP